MLLPEVASACDFLFAPPYSFFQAFPIENSLKAASVKFPLTNPPVLCSEHTRNSGTKACDSVQLLLGSTVVMCAMVFSTSLQNVIPRVSGPIPLSVSLRMSNRAIDSIAWLPLQFGSAQKYIMGLKHQKQQGP